MRTTTILTSLLVVVPSIAVAEGAPTATPDPPIALDEARPDLVASPPTDNHITFVRKRLPAVNTPPAAVAQSRIIYLNKSGVTLTPGDDDSRTNRSSIITSTRGVPAWNPSATVWNATVACLKDMFARWDVTVVETDPGNVPHMEAVFTGSPSSIGMSSGVGGVSPFTEDCGVIENSIVFAFTNAFGNNAQTICEVMAQEVAHSYGLDHELLASDPMTYLNYNGKRTFKDQTVSCGEYSSRACGIGGSVCRPNQNSVQLLTQRLGLADVIAPMLAITSPQDGAQVAPGFSVEATASDNVAVTQASLLIDGQMVTTTPGGGPFTFSTDAMLAEGSHSITVEVSDGKNKQSQTIAVTVTRPGGSGSGNGSGDGNGGAGDGDGDGGDGGLSGGCSSGSGVGFAVGLFFLAHMMIRRPTKSEHRAPEDDMRDSVLPW
jgi:hypothetical protein